MKPRKGNTDLARRLRSQKKRYYGDEHEAQSLCWCLIFLIPTRTQQGTHERAVRNRGNYWWRLDKVFRKSGFGELARIDLERSCEIQEIYCEMSKFAGDNE